MSNKAAAISDLGNIAGSVALIRAAAMPDLVVKHNDTSGFAQIVVDFIFPRRFWHFRNFNKSQKIEFLTDILGRSPQEMEIIYIY